jgi:hypothetical protein
MSGATVDITSPVTVRDQVAVVDADLENIMTANKAVLDPETRTRIIEAKITCPFLGSAANQERLIILGEAGNPLASLEDVRRLGNTGGGDLGDLLVLFAKGNHAFMRSGSAACSICQSPQGCSHLSCRVRRARTPGTAVYSRVTRESWILVGYLQRTLVDWPRLQKGA